MVLENSLRYLRRLALMGMLGGCWLGFSALGWAQPQVAQTPEVRECEFLTQITGHSGYGKDLAWQRLAKYAVFAQADKLAATHIVWVRFELVGAFNGIAVAKAYQCKAD